jgi:hypothetical protein
MAKLAKENKLYADSIKITSYYNQKMALLVKGKNIFEDSLNIYNSRIQDLDKKLLSVESPENLDTTKRTLYEHQYLKLLMTRENLQIRLVSTERTIDSLSKKE